jgi:hypothetical protein
MGTVLWLAIKTDYIGNWKSNYHRIMTTTIPTATIQWQESAQKDKQWIFKLFSIAGYECLMPLSSTSHQGPKE